MKKLLVLLFAFAVAFSMAMPVFAQPTGQDTTTTTTTKKMKKTKKAKKTTTTAPAPTQ
jgi:ABC-type transporter MlaC component